MALKLQFKYGFWIAFAYFIWWTLEKMLGLQSDLIAYRSQSTLISCVIPFVGIYIAMRRLKKNHFQKSGTGELAIQGGIVLVMAAVMCILLAQVFYHLVNPDFSAAKVTYVLERIQETHPETDINKKRELAEASFSPMSMSISHFSWLIMSGLVFLIPQAILAKKIK